ncbi:SDR family NAD(P)-dependent oxidoreductase [Acuticoccus sp. M5D2P5]|uniref:SDR family NAD(P)-dependent oxidoreductase n=1 Tax=Acuticoccus kalidii TaxID=2910977 RepID=UPI001F43B61C|nr:SDR family NAD(P)-dependent oxidoreductase [Acuticoccus kalidii]MCF3936292.1 SDR family NAD(P)-dependent oxidoreductase [Acuticoccus kalidii]
MIEDRLKDRLKRTPREPATCAVITGATRGIGEAFARELAPTTRLILTGRDEERLAALKAEFGPRTEIVSADLTTDEGIGAVAATAEEAGCDLLINNAGVGDYGSFLDVDFEKHRQTLRVDNEAVLALIHRLVPGMVERAELSGRRAGVINVASSLAFFPVPTFATYAAAKAFVLSFTESFAAEMADSPIDILAACPGAVKTGFGERAGYRGAAMPGAMSAEKVARASLAALGRQRTLVIGPVSSAAFGPVAFARSMFGQAFMRASQVMDRVQTRG